MLIDTKGIGDDVNSPLNILLKKLRSKDIEPGISKPVFREVFTPIRIPVRQIKEDGVKNVLMRECFWDDGQDLELP